MKYLLIALGLLTAFPAYAGSYHPMPSDYCLRSPTCMSSFATMVEEERALEEKANAPIRYIDHGKPETPAPVPKVKRCVEKPGGWSELEFYEQNTWYFQTWGRLMTVEEKEAFRCGWPA